MIIARQPQRDTSTSELLSHIHQNLPPTPTPTEVTSSTTIAAATAAAAAAAEACFYYDSRYPRRFNEVSSTSPASSTSGTAFNGRSYDGYRYNACSLSATNSKTTYCFNTRFSNAYQSISGYLSTRSFSRRCSSLCISRPSCSGHVSTSSVWGYSEPQCLRGPASSTTTASHPNAAVPAHENNNIPPEPTAAPSAPQLPPESTFEISSEQQQQQPPPPPRRANICSPPAAHSTESTNYPPYFVRDVSQMRVQRRYPTFSAGTTHHRPHQVGAPPPYLVHHNLWCRQQTMQEIHRRHLTPTPIDLSSNRSLPSYRSRQIQNICPCVHSRTGPVPAYQMVSLSISFEPPPTTQPR
ncbi:uncharacterized protein LOC129908822 [Episyrphus balteatus]|uniref:uncharacterized protein LOC129908822 n=1 Tax=Episyrphus balteatus TaxID=286459 RepID=UPI0024850C8E|nr:uncharacterized protein LOC129908822 [Episyrphus balteatus]